MKEIRSSCSVSCGKGNQTITTITCSDQKINGECAYAPKYETREEECIVNRPCPGKYGAWSEWSPCSKSCTTVSEEAIKSRTRNCIGEKCEDDCFGGTIGKY